MFPYAKEGPSAEDKALDLFADMMIERIQSLSGKDAGGSVRHAAGCGTRLFRRDDGAHADSGGTALFEVPADAGQAGCACFPGDGGQEGRIPCVVREAGRDCGWHACLAVREK